MMKFDYHYYDLNPQKDRIPFGDVLLAYGAGAIPTVDEIEEFISPMTADTILQILRGQAYWHGYECERYCNNDIPDIKSPPIEFTGGKTKRATKRAFAYALRQISLRRKISEDEAWSLINNSLRLCGVK